ncbi:pentatricopeptide repeat-containing protein At4g30700-like [Tasmannia lanceolata]|uniref:pentatricopeptide repeat-containing protein At4g30700-like n=1 Tax=Tasmannia lanceolata TaxID=3420 RepID=UPI00406447FC
MKSLHQIHAQTITTGLAHDPIVLSELLRFCTLTLPGNSNYALLLISYSHSPNLFSFNLALRALSASPSPEKTLTLYHRMIMKDIPLNNYTYPFPLKACASFSGVRQGEEIHGRFLKSGLEPNLVSLNSLMHFYMVCGFVDEAHKLFEEMPERNVVVWSTLINGYVKSGRSGEAFGMFVRMVLDGLSPNEVTMISLLYACGQLRNLWMGKWVHCLIEKLGIEDNIVLGTGLIDMYCKCGDVDAAVQVFDRISKPDSLAWSVMIAGLVSNGYFDKGLELFEEIVCLGVNLTALAFTSAFKACAGLGDFKRAKQVHIILENCNIEMSLSLSSSIIDMYMKFGDFEAANLLFAKVAKKDVVIWTSMIAGFAHHGCSKEAVVMFYQMIEADFEPNEVTLTCVLSASSQLENLSLGTWVHQYIKKQLVEPSVVLCNSLVDMYAKCGSVIDALQVFKEMPEKDLSSWNIVINGLARNGASIEALHHFSSMVNKGIRPNSITFVGVLSACNHAGFVDCGSHYFDSMSSKYGILPGVEHYACMVDLLGRAGLVQEAEMFVEKMPVRADAVVWGALLGACRIHKNVDIAERTVRKLVELEPDKDGAYVLLSKIYAEADRWEDAKKVRRVMDDRGIKKRPGYSWIEVGGVVHLFFAGDKSHIRWDEMQRMLDSIDKQLKLEGLIENKPFMAP